MLGILNKNTSIKNEVLAGLTVALALVPEVIAFAFLAGIDPIKALQASVIIGLCTAIFGGRPGMISGAAGSVAVVFKDLISEHGIEYLFATVVLMGIVQILFGVFKFGKFARMIPHPVILGFLNGLAIVIFLAQLEQFKLKKVVEGVVTEPVEKYWMSGTNLYIMIALVILTMAIVHFLPKLTKAIPASLVAIGVTTGIALFLGKYGIILPNVEYAANGGIAGGLPSFHLPNIPVSFHTFKILIHFAVVAALVGLIESLLTLSVVDELTDTRGKGNKECVGQGIGNLVNGFMGGTGGCAMIGQSIVNITSNGKGRLSGIATALSLLFFVMFGSKLIGIIPLAALVGVMFMVVIETFAWESLKLGKKVPLKEIVIIVIVAVITVKHDLAVGVIVGVIISALIFAWEKGKNITSKSIIDENGVKIYIMEGPLFFGSMVTFKENFDFKNDPKEVIIDFENSHVTDHSAIEAINFVTSKYKENDKVVHLRHLSGDCKTLLQNAEEIIEVNIEEDPKYHIADDLLG